MRKTFLAILTAVSIAALTLPARRVDAATSAHLTPSGDPTNIACPGNLTVTAEAAGTAGAPLAYDIRSVFNGQSAWVVTPTTFDLPPSGAASRTLVVPIPKLTGSGNFLQLDVDPVNAPAITVKVPVACAVPGGDLAVPSDVARDESSAECHAHFSDASLASSCDSEIATKFVLRWNYDENGCVNKPCVAPDGFNILRSEHGSAYVVTDAQNRGPGQTGIVFAEPPTDVYGSCFEVQARKGGADLGVPSSAYCAVPDPVTLQAFNYTNPAINFHTSMMTNAFTGCPASGGNPKGQQILTHNAGELDVGYIMLDNSCSNTDSLREGVVQFDFSHLLPYKIRAATFTMYVAATAQNEGATDIHSNGSESESLASCAVSIGTPLPWNAAPNDLNARIAFTPIASLPSPRSDRSIRVDVTDLARTWAAAKGSNNGLVVSAKPQSLSDVYGLRAPYHSDQECLTAYTGLNIKIDYEL